MVLVARRGVATVSRDAQAAADLLCELAGEHRDTVQVGRTLLQDGALTTFGAHLAARLVAVDEALDSLVAVAERRLCLQLGGPVGALPPVGEAASEYVSAVAAELGLPEPVVPWHTSRGRIAELASACAVLAGELGAVASDIVLLSQPSIGEVAVAEPGGSSAMPHKRNPSAAVLAIACAHRAPGLVATVLSGMRQELQRAAGTWQAEWDVVSELLRLVAATAAHTRRSLDGLFVDVDRMRLHAQSLDATADPGRATEVVDRALRAHRTRTSSRMQAEQTP
jgi:3-carboxy-cis,cis-muconate cycloisomerase